MSQDVLESRLSTFFNWSAAPQFVTHQIAWWACVLWMSWTGPMVMVAFLLVHLYFTRTEWPLEMRLILISTLVGALVDNSLHLVGAVRYVGELTVPFSPLWLLAIWAGFGATLRHHQSMFVRRWYNAVLIGVVGGPLAYFGGQKLARIDVVGFYGWSCVSIAWTLAMVILFVTVKGLEQRRSQPTATSIKSP